eukprot:8654771-Pyramimonas_sp.AAC.1
MAISTLSSTSGSFTKMSSRSGSSILIRLIGTSQSRPRPSRASQQHTPAAEHGQACLLRATPTRLRGQGPATWTNSSGGPSPRTRFGGTSRRRAALSTGAARDAGRPEPRPTGS